MNMTRTTIIALIAIFILSCNKEKTTVASDEFDKIKLGNLIFNDKSLSNPIGLSCASCHNANTGFSDPNHSIVSEGAVSGLYTNRNAPSIAYAAFAPPLYYDNVDSTYVGGLFLDGRVNTLTAQAQKPFLNPLEMNNESISMLINKIKSSSYYSLYKQVYGEANDTNTAFNNISEAIASFEKSPYVNPFTSKYDYYLKGQATLTAQELRGLNLFNDTSKGKCANCHISEPDPEIGYALFTDFTYDNIGIPKNPDNPYYSIPNKFNPLGQQAIDYGLGGFLNDPNNYGRFKVPSLRNAAITAPYFHNGYFKTLEDVVHFYNARDIEHYPPAEIPSTVNHEELGNLKLTTQEEADIVAFIKTLTDGYK